jgi:hypothetical protein
MTAYNLAYALLWLALGAAVLALAMVYNGSFATALEFFLLAMLGVVLLECCREGM